MYGRTINPRAASSERAGWFKVSYPDKKIYRFDGENEMLINFDGESWAGGRFGSSGIMH